LTTSSVGKTMMILLSKIDANFHEEKVIVPMTTSTTHQRRWIGSYILELLPLKFTMSKKFRKTIDTIPVSIVCLR
jgi:hypothetical protein